MGNLDLWNKVKETDPAFTKPAKISGHNITAITPQYQIMKATEQFGPYAKTWGFKDIDLDMSLVLEFKVVIFKGTFFCPDGECQIINSAKLFIDRNEKMFDASFAKKIETDSLTKALSKMGFSADIFMGQYEDSLYVEDLVNKQALESADDKIEEQARQDQEYSDWLESHLKTISTAASMNELEKVFKICVRKAKTRNDEVAMVKFTKAKDVRKGELSNDG